MKAFDSMRAAVSHAAAACAVMGASLAFVLVGFLGMLAWAVVARLPLGGPLALPAALLVALFTSAAAVLLALLPATFFAHFICRKVMGWPVAAEIPISSLLTFGITVFVSAVVGSFGGVPVSTAAAQGAILGLLLLVPLGVYWWVLRVSDWGIKHGQRLLARVVRAPVSDVE